MIKSEVFPHHIAQMETCHHTTSAEDRKSSWRFWLLFLPYAHRAAFHFSNTNLLLQWMSNVFLPWSLLYSHSQASRCFDDRLPILEVILSSSLCTQPSPCRFKFITCNWYFLPLAHRKLFFSCFVVPHPPQNPSIPIHSCPVFVSILVLIVVGTFIAKPLTHIYMTIL